MIQCVDNKHTYVQFVKCGEPISSHPIQHWHATITATQKKMYELSTTQCLRHKPGMFPNSVCIRACDKDDYKIQNRTRRYDTTYYP